MTNYQNFPFVEVENTTYKCSNGWDGICKRLQIELSKSTDNKILVVETYQGVIHEELIENLKSGLNPSLFINVEKEVYKSPDAIEKMVSPDVTDDRVFGYLSRLQIDAYFDENRLAHVRKKIESQAQGLIIIYGPGAAKVWKNHDLLVYADMARWEIQTRMRKNLVDNLGVKNRNTEDWMLLYKQGYFVDWRVLDKWKKKLMREWDFVLDSNVQNMPKLVEGKAILEGLEVAVTRPFSVVPFFDPGLWGGQWMKEYCNLDKSTTNYAWCFNCVPEENSLLLKIDGEMIEIPSINVVINQPEKLLGDPVHGRFGDEFPIRFDFLDTMDGGNLSLQVHPLTEYIQEKFGMPYTQDESYYMMDVKEGAHVYLGLKDEANPETFLNDLKEAQKGEKDFDADKHVAKWMVKKHDHVLIPAGTVHCSGKDSMVLEISATPYIFTFKLWDWARVGMDGKPRPINIEHGMNVIQWDRKEKWTEENLLNQVQKVAKGNGWLEERTGLHEREFIETRRHWFTKKISLNTNGYRLGGVHVLCLVEGNEIIVESPANNFNSFIIHYAETFIVPAAVGKYTIRPHGKSVEKKCATMLAYVRH